MMEEFPEYEKVLPALVENVGFVFTNGDMIECRDLLLENKKAAPARAGAAAPVDVIVPAQNTGLGPEKTSFFQALSIQTKIARGTIEIVNPVHLLKPGDKVGLSEATLLNMLKISPFSYGLQVVQCYEEGSFRPRNLGHHRRRHPSQIHGWRQQRCFRLPQHRLPNFGFCSSQRRQRFEKIVGRCCCHRYLFPCR